MQRFTASRTGRHVLAVGSFHFAVGFSLQVYTRRFYWMDWTGVANKLLMLLSYIYAGLALVAAGALVVILWRRYRLVGPALATSGWFLWGLYGLWQLRESLPLSNIVGID